MAATVVARGVVAGYGGAAVLDGVDVTVGPGDAIGLLGASGVGKSTLLAVLGGEIPATLGSVAFEGHRVFKPARRDRKMLRARLRTVHQNGLAGLDPTQSVERAVRGALDEARAAGRSTGRDTVSALELFGLPAAFAGRRIGTLSGGERQRLTLAIALAPRPDVVLLDEPLTAVDPQMRLELARLVAAVAADEGIGLLVASHDMALLDALTRSVHVLADGRLVEHGPLRTVLADPKHEATRELATALAVATRSFAPAP
ncbi:MAG: ATP-binding cassette domain-containing protein [Cellulomonas sp.]|nr:ATP-binding cassette domain-containing protein [Cellulomonas sp.]